MKFKKTATLFSALVLSVSTISLGFSENALANYEKASDEVETQNVPLPLDPSTALDAPADGGNWIGQTTIGSPSRQGDVRTDRSTAAGIATLIAGPFSFATSAVMGIATIIHDRTAPTTYYDVYSYYSDGADGPQLIMGTVVYYYTESGRNSSDFAGRAASTHTITESLPPEILENNLNFEKSD